MMLQSLAGLLESNDESNITVEQSTSTGWRRPAGLSRHDPAFNCCL